ARGRAGRRHDRERRDGPHRRRRLRHRPGRRAAPRAGPARRHGRDAEGQGEGGRARPRDRDAQPAPSTVNAAPCGSDSTAKRPAGIVVGAMTTPPPRDCAVATVASQSSTANATPQNDGASGGNPAPISRPPATVRPSSLNSVYGAPAYSPVT